MSAYLSRKSLTCPAHSLSESLPVPSLGLITIDSLTISVSMATESGLSISTQRAPADVRQECRVAICVCVCVGGGGGGHLNTVVYRTTSNNNHRYSVCTSVCTDNRQKATILE